MKDKIKADRDTRHDPCPGDKGTKVPFMQMCFNPSKFDAQEAGQDAQEFLVGTGETVGRTVGAAVGGTVDETGDQVGLLEGVVWVGLIGTVAFFALEYLDLGFL